MTLLDPADRTRRGGEQQALLLAAPASTPATPYEAASRDFVFAEVWTRPGLDLRARYLIAMASAAGTGDRAATTSYVRGALANHHLNLAELREAALHVAVYFGWSLGGILDAAITDAADALRLPAAPCPPIRAAPWDPDQRHQDGIDSFLEHMKTGGPPPQTAFFSGGILNFVFGEMWSRPGLDQRSRRWLTLVGVGNSAANIPIRSHVWSAMKSGNATRDEMFEFVLQYAVHSGWPRASVMQSAVFEQSANIEKGLSFDA